MDYQEALGTADHYQGFRKRENFEIRRYCMLHVPDEGVWGQFTAGA